MNITHVMIDKVTLRKIMEGLHISYDAVKAEAEYYRSAMGGYRPYRQKQLDEDVEAVKEAMKLLNNYVDD